MTFDLIDLLIVCAIVVLGTILYAVTVAADAQDAKYLRRVVRRGGFWPHMPHMRHRR